MWTMIFLHCLKEWTMIFWFKSLISLIKHDDEIFIKNHFVLYNINYINSAKYIISLKKIIIISRNFTKKFKFYSLVICVVFLHYFELCFLFFDFFSKRLKNMIYMKRISILIKIPDLFTLITNIRIYSIILGLIT